MKFTKVIRAMSFGVLLFVALLAPLPLFLFLSMLYIFLWDGYELLIVSVLVDSVFGVVPSSFTYTLSIGILLVLATLVRPYLSWYNSRV